MGLTKEFLRYAPDGMCNIVASTWSNFTIVNKPSQKGPLCAVGACENVVVWDMRKGEKHSTLLSEDKHQVTYVASSPDNHYLAAGYANGSVRIFDLVTTECIVTFNGHKKPVSCLNFDGDSLQLASGGMDTDVVLWDVVDESGMFRLKGHTGVITQVRFFQNKGILITSSKDRQIKFWDLQTQHCFKTIMENDEEIYDFILLTNASLMVTGIKNSHLSVWSLTFKMSEATAAGADAAKPRSKLSRVDHADVGEARMGNDDEDVCMDNIVLVKLGEIKRVGKGRLVSMCVYADMYFGCHGTYSEVELFKICTDEEREKHRKKREKKRRLKLQSHDPSVSDAQPPDDGSFDFDTLYKRVGYYKLQNPIRTFQFFEINGTNAKIMVMYRNNSFAKFDLDISTSSKVGAASTSTADQIPSSHCLIGYGHYKEPRCLAFSSDNFSFLSASVDAIKVWNRSSLQCFRTIPCSDVTCCMFALEDRQAIVGKKTGELEMYEISSNQLVEQTREHTGCINAMSLAPNKLGFITGATDRQVIFWEFEFNNESKQDQQSSKALTVAAKRKLQTVDEVLCLKYSSDQKYIAVGCLNMKAYIYFTDSLKMLHTLYSHNMPVTCIDMSTDTHFIATGSSDKDVKLWSMDFGECRKIIKVAHDDKITCLQFVPKTHLFFTCSVDMKVKKWDADSFQLVMTLEGHQAAVHHLSISPNGKYVVSASADMSIRLWHKTEEILILDEEKEMVREKEEEEAMRENIQVPGESVDEVGISGKKTFHTLSATEKLCEALDLYKEEKKKILDYESLCKQSGKKIKPPAVHLLFQAFKVTVPEDYLLEVIKKIKSNDVEECLLITPFSYIMQLVPLLADFLNKGREVELVSRCLFFILRIHAGQIVSNQLFSSVLENVNEESLVHIKLIKDMLGYNLMGLKFLQQKLEEGNSLSIFAEAVQQNKQKKRRRKKALLVVKS
ncbi:hypothetical protein HELRODRAFT_66838 [Helobdella robusta]|uniref:Small-subunit processome Utp12 domain-containing protein n=1 Tax=Helobdella robusta TaxID=6412 RepID=T1FYR8_HELRO|nr:hypothetical protein HELRODRAFT_66838 [Helobdella robusta]ESN98784.1 hypothetical protein HELRODRAFT_66838 [Helobdella robusta]